MEQLTKKEHDVLLLFTMQRSVNANKMHSPGMKSCTCRISHMMDLLETAMFVCFFVGNIEI